MRARAALLHIGKILGKRIQWTQRTRNSAASSTATKMVDNSGIALHDTLNSEIAAVSCIGYLLVLEHSDSGFNGLNCAASAPQNTHRNLRSTETC